MRSGTDNRQAVQDLIGGRIVSHLNDSLPAMPHDISERLRAGRMQALARRKQLAVSRVVHAPAGLVSAGPAAVLASGPDERFGLWQMLGSVVPVIVLAVGLFLADTMQTELRVRELAEVDSALLADEVPPAAYADPGFIQFMKTAE